MNHKKLLLPTIAAIIIATSFTVIYAQAQPNHGSKGACHIFPVRTPAGDVYPENAQFANAFQVGADGDCNDACDFCDGITNPRCIDHYGCDCFNYNGLDCKGN